MIMRESNDKELLALMERYLEAHRRRGTAPTDATMLRYRELRTRVLHAEIELARSAIGHVRRTAA
jgi:uncharacterized glyoxalase superfamily protein PhnB